jgi:hypothetical protein
VVEHSFETEATSHPVSRGEAVSDHLIPQPDTISLQGIISRTPIDPSIAFGDGGKGRYRRAFDKLRDLKERPRLITLITSRRTYPSMVLLSLSITDDAVTGDSIQFSATFKHIRQVQTEVTQFSEASQRPDSLPSVKPIGQQSAVKLPDGTSLGGLVPVL